MNHTVYFRNSDQNDWSLAKFEGLLKYEDEWVIITQRGGMVIRIPISSIAFIETL